MYGPQTRAVVAAAVDAIKTGRECASITAKKLPGLSSEDLAHTRFCLEQAAGDTKTCPAMFLLSLRAFYCAMATTGAPGGTEATTEPWRCTCTPPDPNPDWDTAAPHVHRPCRACTHVNNLTQAFQSPTDKAAAASLSKRDTALISAAVTGSPELTRLPCPRVVLPPTASLATTAASCLCDVNASAAFPVILVRLLCLHYATGADPCTLIPGLGLSTTEILRVDPLINTGSPGAYAVMRAAYLAGNLPAAIPTVLRAAARVVNDLACTVHCMATTIRAVIKMFTVTKADGRFVGEAPHPLAMWNMAIMLLFSARQALHEPSAEDVSCSTLLSTLLVRDPRVWTASHRDASECLRLHAHLGGVYFDSRLFDKNAAIDGSLAPPRALEATPTADQQNALNACIALVTAAFAEDVVAPAGGIAETVRAFATMDYPFLNNGVTEVAPSEMRIAATPAYECVEETRDTCVVDTLL